MSGCEAKDKTDKKNEIGSEEESLFSIDLKYKWLTLSFTLDGAHIEIQVLVFKTVHMSVYGCDL